MDNVTVDVAIGDRPIPPIVNDLPGAASTPRLVNPVSGAVVLLDPPVGQTLANTDNKLSFRQQVNHVLIQNNTNQTVYVDFDSTSSPGDIAILAGQLFSIDIPCNDLHIYTQSVVTYNGTVAGNLVIKGWL